MAEDNDARRMFPMPIERWRAIRMSLDTEESAALLDALMAYYVNHAEPGPGLTLAGRLMFEYLRPRVDADRAAVEAGEILEGDIVWIRPWEVDQCPETS